MDCIRQKLLGKPETGILYPAFHDRSEDINALLYYDKKGSDRQDEPGLCHNRGRNAIYERGNQEQIHYGCREYRNPVHRLTLQKHCLIS